MSLIYRNIVVLTGAGISAESGISTFRDQNGLWENHRIEDVATPEGFQRNPALVHQFYNLRRAQLKDPKLQPNAAHLALAELETRLFKAGGHFTLITQNVDNLHQRAGSRNLISMHGQLQSILCPRSRKTRHWENDLSVEHLCDCCDPPQLLRPDIVWFGEVPYRLDDCYQALTEADLFIAIGTSGQVYPAAGFTRTAAGSGAHTVELNLEQTGGSFDAGYYGPATQVVPAFVAELFATESGTTQA